MASRDDSWGRGLFQILVRVGCVDAFRTVPKVLGVFKEQGASNGLSGSPVPPLFCTDIGDVPPGYLRAFVRAFQAPLPMVGHSLYAFTARIGSSPGGLRYLVSFSFRFIPI